MIGVIADDLTGAAELGAIGARFGLKSELYLEGGNLQSVELACLDTDSRFGTANDSAASAASAARALMSDRAEWVYKKVDSVLRGQVVAEVTAIMRELGLPLALLMPANPSLGRTIRNGCYYIREQLIHETEFARDPAHPRNSPHVLDLLGNPVHACVRRLDQELPASGVVVGEVNAPDQLNEWAKRCSAPMLVAGGAEFFAALLRNAGHTISAPAVTSIREQRPQLFVCGSPSDSAREFAAAERKKGTPAFSLPPDFAQGADLDSETLERLSDDVVQALAVHPRVLLEVNLPLVQDQRIARGLSSHLVRIAETVLRKTSVAHVFAEGGATARVLAMRMGWLQLPVVAELAPGVATLRTGSERAPLFTLKPGSYRWPIEIQQPSPGIMRGDDRA